MDTALRAPSTFNSRNEEWQREWQAAWFAEMRHGGLRERMALLWHNHFVTELRTYRLAVYAYRYLTLLRTHALGNFKQLAHAARLLLADTPWYEWNLGEAAPAPLRRRPGAASRISTDVIWIFEGTPSKNPIRVGTARYGVV